MRCQSNTYGVHNGVITVPMYQNNSAQGGLNTYALYVVAK